MWLEQKMQPQEDGGVAIRPARGEMRATPPGWAPRDGCSSGSLFPSTHSRRHTPQG